MSLEKATLGKGSRNTNFFTMYPLNFKTYALCIAYSKKTKTNNRQKTSMFKRGLQQTPCLVCHDKGGIELLLDGQLDKHWMKINSMGFPQRLPLKHLSCVSSVYHQWAKSNSLHSALLQTAPKPRVQILVLTFASHMGGSGSFTPPPRPPHPTTLSLKCQSPFPCVEKPELKIHNGKPGIIGCLEAMGAN